MPFCGEKGGGEESNLQEGEERSRKGGGEINKR